MTYLFSNTISGNVNIYNSNGQPIANSTPLPVTGNVVVSSYPSSSVTAFDEPLSVGITPVIQSEAVYGLDSNNWKITQLSSGTVVANNNSVWEVSSGTSAGGYARLATMKYMTYQPGQGSMFRWTVGFTTTGGTDKNAYGIDNIVQNSGPIDREDGYSIGYSGATSNNSVRKIGFLHRRGGGPEIRNLTVTTAPTGTQTATITLDGTAYTVPLTTSSNTAYTAKQIALGLQANNTASNSWDIQACGSIVTFVYYSPGARSGTYSFSSTGTGTVAAGSFSQVSAGVSPTDVWTYVDDWDNKTVNFDPTKLNVFGIDFRWLGAGIVRLFMEDPATGRMVLLHTQRWSSQYIVPHIKNPSLRLIYRSGTTNPAITPSQNVVVRGASVFAGIQGSIIQTRMSQSYYSIDSTARAKDIIHHLLSIQNTTTRAGIVNKTSLILQDLSIAAQGSDPSILYLVKNAVGISDYLVFNPLPNASNSLFTQYSVSVVQENLELDSPIVVQVVGINGAAQFPLLDYNIAISPGESVSLFFSSSSPISKTIVGLAWKVD